MMPSLAAPPITKSSPTPPATPCVPPNTLVPNNCAARPTNSPLNCACSAIAPSVSDHSQPSNSPRFPRYKS
ncbi:hypothetical protein [Lysobacter gummosus]|uniref:hypothetical protein n=1 Tax=Lysobacter gummosus TaxID=262324 RepID=UPI003627AC62